MRRLTVPASAVVLALTVAACGSSEHASKRAATATVALSTTVRARTTLASPSPAEIERAATLTAREPGFRAAFRATIEVPRLSGTVTTVGSGYFDPGSGSGTLEVAAGLPGLLGLAGPLPAQVRLVGSEAYVHVPSDLAGDLGIADAWLQENIATLGLGDWLSPSDILREVARDATQPVPGQRAHVTIDPATGLVRTVALVYTRPGGYHVHVRLTLTGFGAQSATQPPPPGEVGELQAALNSLGF